MLLKHGVKHSVEKKPAEVAKVEIALRTFVRIAEASGYALVDRKVEDRPRSGHARF